ncbi:MAG: hypothetical protein H0W08_18355 [Acidobacteria bacterium]|nr:hypothetical protein [Acidobacteriota bacterium]
MARAMRRVPGVTPTVSQPAVGSLPDRSTAMIAPAGEQDRGCQWNFKAAAKERGDLVLIRQDY